MQMRPNPELPSDSGNMVQCRTPLKRAKVLDPIITEGLRSALQELYAEGPTSENTLVDLPRFYSIVRHGKAIWQGSAWEEAVRAVYSQTGYDVIPYNMTGKVGEQPFAHVLGLPPVCGWVPLNLMVPDNKLGYYSNFKLDTGLQIR